MKLRLSPSISTIGGDPALTIGFIARLAGGTSRPARPTRPTYICTRLDRLVLPNPPLRGGRR